MTRSNFRTSLRSAARLVLAVAMVATGVGLTALPTATPAAAEPAPRAGSSAVTVKGSGRFSSLEVTVSQTKDLINQTIHLSWKGAAPTDNPPGKNFLQIMQCWGDNPTGPDREQCQYGAPVIDYFGEQIESRTLSYHESVKDPKEVVTPPGAPYSIVPFRSVTGKTTSTTVPDYDQFFDSQNTNEISVAPTQEGGTGELDFEVLTGLESHGLGCGKPRTEGPDKGKPRHCWLVIVPRDDIEVTGKVAGPGGHLHNYLDSSPLSKSNFEHKLTVKLDFLMVGDACPIGANERALSGSELLADAVIRWQPALCSGNGPVFGYAQVPDRLARDQLASPEPGLVFTSKPLDPALVPPDRKLVYAPTAVSSYVVAFIMERQASISAPPEVVRQNGQIITELKLTPRLMAKLLTQSYSGAVYTKETYLSKNPRRLVEDQEFLALNPVFKDYGFSMHTVEPLLTSVDSDATEAMWTWINQDREARDFLDGKPDPYNMVVNKNYTNMRLPIDFFARADSSCIIVELGGGSGTFPKCTLNSRGMAADLHQAARAASRGDSLQREPQPEPDPNDPSKPLYKKNERTRVGARALIAIVDSPTADRYGLPVAKLRNAAGEFVSPKDNGAVQAGVDGMIESKVPGVLLTNPSVSARNAYPLPLVTYAVAAPATMDAASGKDYATFLRYATGQGQVPGDGVGTLPSGYLPLPSAMTRAASDAAATIERDAGKKLAAPKPSETASGESSGESGSDGSSGGATGDGQPPAPAPAPGAPAPAPAPPAAVPPSAEATPARAVRNTPSLPISWEIRYLLAGLLVLGGLATGAGPLLMRLGARTIGPRP
ncbi:hypothetical protein [Actinokineospora sp. HUAS TT18]|uniref:hypothetical protein n=1 Tax=Actinokineospora sp. HUAS TT18 TaxID=3447451 RepID=UPI003F526088